MSTRRFRGRKAADASPKEPRALCLELPRPGSLIHQQLGRMKGRQQNDRHPRRRTGLVALADAIGKPEPWA